MPQLNLFNEEILRKPDEALLLSLKEQNKSCRKCVLRQTCKQPVFGEGNWNRPKLAFIGEAPGADEDIQARPFVGRSGQLLDKMIEALGMKREEVYILNTACCRPPGNRQPTPEEILQCREWFVGQLRAVQPRVMIGLGAIASNNVLDNKKPAHLGDMRGVWHDWQGIPFRATFHPAYLLRSPSNKADAWLDFQTAFAKAGQSAG